jgi:hypothetical protein
MNAVTQTEAAALASNFTSGNPAPYSRNRASSPEEHGQEQREEAALCELDSLTNFLSCDGEVFKHDYWLSAAARIENDYINAAKFTTPQLLALMFMAAKSSVVLACREEIRNRYLIERRILTKQGAAA